MFELLIVSVANCPQHCISKSGTSVSGLDSSSIRCGRLCLAVNRFETDAETSGRRAGQTQTAANVPDPCRYGWPRKLCSEEYTVRVGAVFSAPDPRMADVAEHRMCKDVAPRIDMGTVLSPSLVLKDRLRTISLTSTGLCYSVRRCRSKHQDGQFCRDIETW